MSYPLHGIGSQAGVYNRGPLTREGERGGGTSKVDADGRTRQDRQALRRRAAAGYAA